MNRLGKRQLLIIVAGLMVVLAVGQWVVGPILGHRKELAARIQRSERRLKDMLHLEQTYRQARLENGILEQSLRSRRQDFTLFAFLEGLARKDGLKKQIEYMRPSVKSLSETFQEEQVEMRLTGVALGTLIPYLYHLETAPEQVRIKRLTIRPQSRNKSLLEVNLLVVTQRFVKGSRAADSKAGRKGFRS
ncbi:MAG: hypothetical protein JSU72_10420 [Deltaproteobacteria bacterium]|nr:MAG: hypothetical protein JSU72_10420 [Deltaproteobacteria bacterium]